MYVYEYLYIYMLTYACMHACMHTDIYDYKYIYIYVYSLYLHIQLLIYFVVHLFVYLYINMRCILCLLAPRSVACIRSHAGRGVPSIHVDECAGATGFNRVAVTNCSLEGRI